MSLWLSSSFPEPTACHVPAQSLKSEGWRAEMPVEMVEEAPGIIS